MTEYVWKHLPYAIYLDTNVLRASGPRLDAPWINELLSITTKHGINLCISELVLAEWCEYIAGVLENNRQKLLSSVNLLGQYGISVPGIQRQEIDLPEKKHLNKMVSEKLRAAGISVIPNWDAPLSELLADAVAKKAPFEEGGKGLCDAVIVESYVKHAKDSFDEPRVLVISRDSAVKRSGDRFKERGVAVDFIDEQSIVEKVKSLLKEEVTAFIEKEKAQLKEYVMSHEAEVLDFVRKTPLKVTDWMLNPPLGVMAEDRVEGTIESILSIKPTRITHIIGGALAYGEEPSQGRYPLQIFVELELDIVVREYGFGLGVFGKTRAIVQPDTLDSSSPVSLEATCFDWKGRETTRTIKRNLTVLATLDAEKEKAGVLEDLRLEGIG
ncbi:MAG: PIN domain-containing protein [Syntrophobacteraceae bacterium]